MNIVIVNKHRRDIKGGSELQCDLIARELSGRGHNVTYIAVQGSSGYDTGYPVVPVSGEPSRIAEQIIQAEPDIVYWRYNKHRLYETLKPITSQNIPVVFAVSHIYDTQKWGAKAVGRDKPLHKRLLIRCMEWLKSRLNFRGFRFVKGVVVNNRQFLNLLPIKQQVYIPSNVLLEATEFKWERPFLLWVGGVKPSKRPELFIEAARYTDLDCLMIGPIQKESYHWLESEPRLPENLYYLGEKSHEEVNAAMKKCSYLVHTGEPEGFPNIFMQAWSVGKQVISFEYDPDGLIQNQQLGTVCGGDREMFFSRISEVIEMEEKDAERIREFAANTFNPSKNIEKLEQFLMDCAKAEQNDD